MKNKILLIHQGAELYGSDRSLLNVIDALKGDYKLEVWLPYEGELCNRLIERGIGYQIKNLSILRLIDVKKGNFSFINKLFLSWKSFKKETEIFDLVLFNTIVCFNFIIPITVPKIIYVREIKGKFLSAVFSFLFYLSNSFLFFNSKPTASHYLYNDLKGKVITNAISDQFTEVCDSGSIYCSKKMNLLFIGRIIKWKGLHLLIDALSRLNKESPDFKFTLNVVGDIYEGYDQYLNTLKQQVEQSGLKERVNFKGFVKNPKNEYLKSDIVIVPSEDPEPFGRVAVEAMMFKKIVIAADHGGLGEIIDDEINGFKFEPRSSRSLLKTLQKICSGKYDLNQIAENARDKYLVEFHTSIYKKSITESVNTIMTNNLID